MRLPKTNLRVPASSFSISSCAGGGDVASVAAPRFVAECSAVTLGVGLLQAAATTNATVSGPPRLPPATPRRCPIAAIALRFCWNRTAVAVAVVVVVVAAAAVDTKAVQSRTCSASIIVAAGSAARRSSPEETGRDARWERGRVATAVAVVDLLRLW